MSAVALPYVVNHVIDGDTLNGSVKMPYGIDFVRRARLLTVNAPELKNPDGTPNDAGVAAQQYVMGLIAPGDTVTLTAPRDLLDQYDRVLGDWVLKDGRSVTQLLIDGGYVKPQTAAQLAKLTRTAKEDAHQLLADGTEQIRQSASARPAGHGG